jgi:hypothetical protein
MATPPPKSAVIAIVTENEELSLACTTNLLRLQQQAAQRGNVLTVNLVPTFLDALNSESHDADYLFVIDSNAGVPPEFVFGVLDGTHDAVAGVYPLPKIDWARITRVLADETSTEPIAHAGNVYNVVPVAGHSLQRYVPVRDVRELRVLAISFALLQSIEGDEFVDDAGVTKKLYTRESVVKERFLNKYQTLARKVPTLVADLESPCNLSAPAMFAGCVGYRGYVR